MPHFTLHRNFVLRTTKGHTIAFTKGKPTYVPPVCVEDAVAIGAIPEDAKDGDVLGAEVQPQPSMTPDERKAKVFEAFGIMKMRNERNDFTASGIPDARRLPPLTGFDLTSKERDAYWLEFRALEQADKDQTNLDAKVAARAEADAG